MKDSIASNVESLRSDCPAGILPVAAEDDRPPPAFGVCVVILFSLAAWLMIVTAVVWAVG